MVKPLTSNSKNFFSLTTKKSKGFIPHKYLQGFKLMLNKRVMTQITQSSYYLNLNYTTNKEKLVTS